MEEQTSAMTFWERHGGTDAEMESLQLIGLFQVYFSSYVSNLELGLAVALAGPSPDALGPARIEAVRALAGSMTAGPLLARFLAASASVLGALSPEEEAICRALNKRCSALTETRNAIAHGSWTLSGNQRSGFDSNEPTLERLRSTWRETTRTVVMSSRDEMQRHVDEAATVAVLVREFSAGVLCKLVGHGADLVSRLEIDESGKLGPLLPYALRDVGLMD